MNQTYTAAIKHSTPWWIGGIEEIPGVNCQESSREELVESLRVTLVEVLEMNREDARSTAGKGCEELLINAVMGQKGSDLSSYAAPCSTSDRLH